MDSTNIHPDLMAAFGVVGKGLHQIFLTQGNPVPGVEAAYLLLLIKLGEGQMGVGRLAEQVHSDTSTVSRQVNALEKMGLVSKSACASDRRIQLIGLTDQGREARTKVIEHRSSILESAMADFDDQEREQLLHLLRKLGDGVEARLAGGQRPARTATAPTAVPPAPPAPAATPSTISTVPPPPGRRTRTTAS